MSPPRAEPPRLPWRPAAIAHGGTGSRRGESDGCQRAVDAALAALDRGLDVADAAVAGVAVLEDDPRFNAGTGSEVRIDGETVQMDAAVMTSRGAFGGVAAIERVQYPAQVARAVMDTPHLLIAGDGATRFAHGLGFAEFDPATEAARARRARIARVLRSADPEALPASWRDFDWRRHWNFARTLREAGIDPELAGTDTVGAAVRAADGSFGVALSTGGTSITLRGRVGDVPVLGAGLYADAGGAVAATGHGERILEAGLARRACEWLAGGLPAPEVAARGVAEIAERGAIGLIVLGPRDLGAAANREMAWAAREQGAVDWQDADR